MVKVILHGTRANSMSSRFLNVCFYYQIVSPKQQSDSLNLKWLGNMRLPLKELRSTFYLPDNISFESKQ
jgi:hypothetical protein